MINRKESKAKKIILPLFIGMIMVLSVLGFALTYNSGGNNLEVDGGSYTYNNHEYTRSQNGWQVNLDQGAAEFQYGPRELEDVSLPRFEISSKIYIAYDPGTKDQNIDFIIQKLNNILLYLNSRPVTACIKSSNECPDIPIVDCNSGYKVIAVLKGEKPEAVVDNNCLYISGSTIDLNKITDKLALTWLGLI